MMLRSVEIDYVHPGMVHEAFMRSLINLCLYDSRHLKLVQAVNGVQGVCIPEQRNTAVHGFLAGSAEWLWFIDTDMVVGPDCLYQLIKAADPTERPIMSALCFLNSRKEGPIPNVPRLAPNWYRLRVGGGYEGIEHPGDGLQQVDGVGMACCLIHRRVLESFDTDKDDWPWFGHDRVYIDGAATRLGEDLTFCRRAMLQGYPIHATTEAKVGHIKPRCENMTTFTAQTKYEEMLAG